MVIRIIIHNPQHKKSLIITGTVDDIMIDFLNNKYVNLKYQAIKENCPQSQEFQGDTFYEIYTITKFKGLFDFRTT